MNWPLQEDIVMPGEEPEAATIYVAGPMSGLPDFNYPAFNDAARALGQAGWVVLNPADTEKLNPLDGPQEWDWYMRHAIRMVLESDAVAMLPGWEKSRGAQLEYTIARALDLKIKALDEWLR